MAAGAFISSVGNSSRDGSVSGFYLQVPQQGLKGQLSIVDNTGRKLSASPVCLPRPDGEDTPKSIPEAVRVGWGLGGPPKQDPLSDTVDFRLEKPNWFSLNDSCLR